jgi:hypothetical protein
MCKWKSSNNLGNNILFKSFGKREYLLHNLTWKTFDSWHNNILNKQLFIISNNKKPGEQLVSDVALVLEQ